MKARHYLLVVVFVFAVYCLTGCLGKKPGSAVAVSGIGTVQVQPDMVQMHISLNKTAETTQEAQQEVGIAVRQALSILQEAGIEEKNITTASLRFYPEYEWGGTGRILLGQKAEQVIIFSSENLSVVPNVIDRLIQINGIELQGMNFNVKDSSELYAKSRELAYQKALEKAEQYAELSGMKIAGIISISEEGIMPVSPMSGQAARNQASFSDESRAVYGSTVLPTGEMEISSRIIVEFSLKQ